MAQFQQADIERIHAAIPRTWSFAGDQHWDSHVEFTDGTVVWADGVAVEMQEGGKRFPFPFNE